MKLFLWLLFIGGFCVGGYYGYCAIASEGIDAQHKINDQREKLEYLETKNKELEEDKSRVTKQEWDATQDKITDLTQKLQAAQDALTAEQKKVKAAVAAAAAAANHTPSDVPPPPPPPPPLPSNNLGTITTQDGTTYKNCKLLKVKADGIVVNQAEGVIKILYALLPADLQKRFGYDPKNAAELPEDQVYLLDSQRQEEAARNPND